MKRLLIICYFFFSSFVYADESHCPIPFEDVDLCAQLKWTRGPLWGGFSQAEVSYWKRSDKEKTLIDPPKDLIVYAWMIMPTMEHGARTPTVKKLKTGTFLVDQIQFMKMPGHWEVRWRKQKADEKEPLAKLKVELPE